MEVTGTIARCETKRFLGQASKKMKIGRLVSHCDTVTICEEKRRRMWTQAQGRASMMHGVSTEEGYLGQDIVTVLYCTVLYFTVLYLGQDIVDALVKAVLLQPRGRGLA